jgi:hypothetical protein
MAAYYTAIYKRRTSFSTAYQRGAAAALKTWAEEIPFQDVAEQFMGDVAKHTQLTELLESMLSQYMHWCGAHEAWDELLGVEVPLRHRVETAHGPVVLQGTIDALFRRDDQIWIVDHKTASQYRSPEMMTLDDQMTAYMWLAAQTYGKLPGGVSYRQVRKKVPVEPDVIRDGSRLSKQVKDTTVEMYLAAIKRHGFDPSDYADILGSLAQNEFVREEVVSPTTYRLAHFEEMLQAELDLMLDPNVVYFPSPSWECTRMCDYAMLCRIMMEEGDTSIAEDLYYVEKRPEER